MSQTILSPIHDLDHHGSFQRCMLEQLMPWCDDCDKAVGTWMEPKNAKDWLEIHWRKKHA
jgi:5-methylcytosine-specific restriction endonuclease McrA